MFALNVNVKKEYQEKISDKYGTNVSDANQNDMYHGNINFGLRNCCTLAINFNHP